MDQYPAVVLIGTRQVGKSTLLRALRPEAKILDLERAQDFQLAEHDPEVLFQDYAKPILFDEAQLSPGLFRAMRVEIDKTRGRNG